MTLAWVPGCPVVTSTAQELDLNPGYSPLTLSVGLQVPQTYPLDSTTLVDLVLPLHMTFSLSYFCFFAQGKGLVKKAT